MTRLNCLALVMLAQAATARAAPEATALPFAAPEPQHDRYSFVERDEAGNNAPQAVQIRGADGPSLTTVVVADRPPVESERYVVRGRVRYENVAGTAYLEMWNDFGQAGAYFTRSLAEVGPMRSITGSSGWRELELPFQAQSGMRPERLKINVVMPGGGTIFLGPLRLESSPASSAWWDERQAGRVGGLAGTLIGCVGALIGALAGFRRARPVVVALCVATIVGGAGLLTAGVLALALGQPWPVYYPLLLLGAISSIVPGTLLPVILRRYRTDEFRRIAALDA
ncbi:MAG: hypothetical protein ACT4QC_09030 [Planctomycetaceae bacterium]